MSGNSLVWSVSRGTWVSSPEDVYPRVGVAIGTMTISDKGREKFTVLAQPAKRRDSFDFGGHGHREAFLAPWVRAADLDDLCGLTDWKERGVVTTKPVSLDRWFQYWTDAYGGEVAPPELAAFNERLFSESLKHRVSVLVRLVVCSAYR